MVGEAFAVCRADRGDATGFVCPPERRPAIEAEIKFSDVAVQMFLAAMLVGAPYSTFEHGEKPLNGIGRHVAARVFLLEMVDRFVRGKKLARIVVQPAFIGMNAAFVGYVVCHDLGDRFLVCTRNVEGAHLAATFYQRNDGALIYRAALLLVALA